MTVIDILTRRPPLRLVPEEVSPWEPAPVEPLEELGTYHPDQPNPFLQLLVFFDDGRHWTKGTFFSHNRHYQPTFCIISGYNMAARGEEFHGAVHLDGRTNNILMEAINGDRSSRRWSSVLAWNDASNRTFGSVRRMLRRAAIIWEQEQGWLTETSNES